MKPYTTMMLEKIKSEENMGLRNVDDIIRNMRNKREKGVFLHIIKTNKNGYMPTYADIKDSPPVQDNSEAVLYGYIRTFLEQGILINPTTIEILSVFSCEKSHKPKLPEKLEKKFFYDTCGRHAKTSPSWEYKFQNSRALRYHRLFIALAEDNGKPVYSKIFYE